MGSIYSAGLTPQRTILTDCTPMGIYAVSILSTIGILLRVQGASDGAIYREGQRKQIDKIHLSCLNHVICDLPCPVWEQNSKTNNIIGLCITISPPRLLVRGTAYYPRTVT